MIAAQRGCGVSIEETLGEGRLGTTEASILSSASNVKKTFE
jgi:hypothetical protein